MTPITTVRSEIYTVFTRRMRRLDFVGGFKTDTMLIYNCTRGRLGELCLTSCTLP